MSQPSPWSIKGIGPEARRQAKLAAQRDGMTLGAWLSQKIADASDAEAAGAASRAPRPPTPAPLDVGAEPSGLAQAGEVVLSAITELKTLIERQREQAVAAAAVAPAPDPRLDQITQALQELAVARVEEAQRMDEFATLGRRLDTALGETSSALGETNSALETTQRHAAMAVRAAAILAERVAKLDRHAESIETATNAETEAQRQQELMALADRLTQRCDQAEARAAAVEDALQSLSARLSQSMETSLAALAAAQADDAEVATEIAAPVVEAAQSTDAEAQVEVVAQAEEAAIEHVEDAVADAGEEIDSPAETVDDALQDAWVAAFEGPAAVTMLEAPQPLATDPWADAFLNDREGAADKPSAEAGQAKLASALRDRLRRDMTGGDGEASLTASLSKIRSLLPKAKSDPADMASDVAREIRAIEERRQADQSLGENAQVEPGFSDPRARREPPLLLGDGDRCEPVMLVADRDGDQPEAASRTAPKRVAPPRVEPTRSESRETPWDGDARRSGAMRRSAEDGRRLQDPATSREDFRRLLSERPWSDATVVDDMSDGRSSALSLALFSASVGAAFVLIYGLTL